MSSGRACKEVGPVCNRCNALCGVRLSSTPSLQIEGTRERYKGTEHGIDNLVEKSKLEIVCFRRVLLWDNAHCEP